jgi:TolA-binding protein
VFRVIHILALALSIASTPAFSEPLAPVIPLAEDVASLPLFDRELLLAPKKSGESLSDSALAKRTENLIGESVTAEGKKKIKLNRDAHISALTLLRLRLDASRVARSAGGALVGDDGDIQKIRQAATWVDQAARNFLVTQKQPKARALAQYQHSVALSVLGRMGDAAKLLSESRQSLPSALAVRAEFVLAWYELTGGMIKSDEVDRLKKVAPDLEGALAVSALLTMARIAAGLDLSGNHVRTANHGEAKAALAALNKHLVKLSPNDRIPALAGALGVWKKVDSAPDALMRFPVQVPATWDEDVRDAVVERRALSLSHKGEHEKAARIYRALSSKPIWEHLEPQLDRQQVSLQNMHWSATTAFQIYEQELIRIGSKWNGRVGQQKRPLSQVERKSHKFKVSEAEALVGLVQKLRHELVQRELARAHGPSVAAERRLAVVGMASRWVQVIWGTERPGQKVVESPQGAPPQMEDVLVSLAGLREKSGLQAAAVETWLFASERFPGAKRVPEWLERAVSLQLVLSRWPASPPWVSQTPDQVATPADLVKPRELLLRIMSLQEAHKDNPFSWQRSAQMGHVHLALGREKEAFAVWRSALDKSTAGRDAAEAAGWMLTRYNATKRWSDLESLARFANSSKIACVHKNQNVDALALLGDALYFGGKEAFVAKSWSVAAAKLDEFAQTFRAASVRDEALAYLGRSRFGEKSWKKGVLAYAVLAQDHPRSKWLREALLDGGNMAADLALEEEAATLLRLFVDRFPADTELSRVRDSLVSIYVGQGRFADARVILKRLIADPAITQRNKIEAVTALIAAEERYGDRTSVRDMAKAFFAEPWLDGGSRAFALSVWARGLSIEKNENELRNIESTLVGLGNVGVAGQEALGEIRFLYARSVATRLESDLTREDDLYTKGSLERRKKAWREVKAAYDKTCSAGQASFCAPANLQIAQTAKMTREALSGIMIPPRATEAEEKQLVKGREEFRKLLENEEKSSLDVAGELLRKGLCSPEWIAEVRRAVKGDWRLEPFDDRSANGFIQWTVAPAQARR